MEFRDVTFRYPSAAEVSLASLEDVAVLDRTITEPVLKAGVLRRRARSACGPGRAVGCRQVHHGDARAEGLRRLRGRVLVGNVDVRDATLSSLRDTIGVVTQDAHLFHETIAENLRYAKPDATDEELWTALERAQIVDLVRALPDGLETVVGERGYRFSGGEKQRIAIARLLLKAPSIVILDEATAHLDSESEAAVQRALTVALQGRTSLVIAHRLSTIRDADRIVVLEAGKVVESGSHDELLAAAGLYSELYRTQFAVADAARPLAPAND